MVAVNLLLVEKKRGKLFLRQRSRESTDKCERRFSSDGSYRAKGSSINALLLQNDELGLEQCLTASAALLASGQDESKLNE